MSEVLISERCIHELNLNSFCKHCGGHYEAIKNDPRPYNVIREERQKRQAQFQKQQ